jgi:hypothetical protein
MESEVPIFISPRNRVAQLYPRTLCSLFVASYDSHGYGGGILTLFHESNCALLGSGSGYFATDSQSANLSCCKAPIWGP